MRSVLLFVVMAIAVTAQPTLRRQPGEMALLLNEEEFENYLEAWLIQEEQTRINSNLNDRLESGCTFRFNDDFGQPQPVYILDNTYLRPSGNSGEVRLNNGDQVRVACTGSGHSIQHPNITSRVATAHATCVKNNLVSGSGWLRGHGAFGNLTCSTHATHNAQETNQKCFNNNTVIRVGFIVDNVFHVLYHSCFDKSRLEVLYVWYNQDATNVVHQSNVDRPNWLASTFFPGANINTVYSQNSQKNAIANIVGRSLADKYVTNLQYLARGHFAAKTDFVFAPGQRATFYFINAAPQWQGFNNGNWNWLEQNLRARIGAANYSTVIYTGTFGVTQLRDESGQLQDIYLRQIGNQLQVPVPMYYYKVVYDSGRRLGTAFVSINNPYYTASEVRQLQFCTDQCRNNAAFSWLKWQPDRIDIGYSFCCTIADFRRVVGHIPNFRAIDLLT
ncbi:hypothetical protein ACJJTC_017703 [Scirpophaga incertulas]